MSPDVCKNLQMFVNYLKENTGSEIAAITEALFEEQSVSQSVD